MVSDHLRTVSIASSRDQTSYNSLLVQYRPLPIGRRLSPAASSQTFDSSLSHTSAYRHLDTPRLVQSNAAASMSAPSTIDPVAAVALPPRKLSPSNNATPVWKLDDTSLEALQCEEKAREVCCKDLRDPSSERHLIDPDVVRDLVIGLADGLTVPFALTAVSGFRRFDGGEHILTTIAGTLGTWKHPFRCDSWSR